MRKKGFTLVELIGTLVLLSVIFLISIPVIMSYIEDVRTSVYRRKESDLEQTAKTFVILNDTYIPKQVGNKIYVTMNLLVTNEVMNPIIDTKTNTACDGYVILNRVTDTKVEYEPFIDCDESYKTNGYANLVGLQPTIDIIGGTHIEHQINTPYVDQGANAFDPINSDITDMIVVRSNVNINIAGTYTVIYEVDNGTMSPVTATRTVVVKDTVMPVITLNGNATINHNIGDVYTDLGATATDNLDGNITANITLSTNLLTSVMGTYTTTYSVTDSSGNTASVSRTINVIDISNPVIVFSMNGNITYAKTRSTTVTVSDVGSGVNISTLEYQWTTSTTAPSEASFTTAFTNGSSRATPASVTGGYYLWILAKDNNGNTAIVRSNIFNLDNINPVITLTGSATINHPAGSAYTDLGSTATDNIDGNITANITVSSNLIPTVIGTYTTTYTILDTAGNTASVSRTINVTDGTMPSVAIGTNGNATYAKTRNTTVTISDAGSGVNPTTLEYQWTTSTTAPSEASFTTTFTNGGTITTPASVTGGYYLWILAKDYAGNTTIIGSNVFNLDNTIPTIANVIGGNMLYADSTFASGTNNMSVYNNLGNGTVTHVRTAIATPVGSYAMRITTNGSASPGAGGFYQLTGTAPSRVYYHRIIAKIPVGYTIIHANNAVGDGSTFTWITSQAGTGNWEEYIYVLRTGTTGTFNTFGFAYLTGPSLTSVTWDVAYATIFDATATANNTIAFKTSDAASLINGYGINQSSTVAPTFTTVTATANLSIQNTNMTLGGTYYIWTRDVAGNTTNRSFIIDTVTQYRYRDQFWCYAAVNSTTAPSCAGTSIGTQGTDYGAYGSSVLQWDSCTTGAANYVYGGYAGADIAYTTWGASGYWSQTRNTSLDLYADYQHVRCGLSVRYKQSGPNGTYNTAYAETRYTRSFTNRVLYWNDWSGWQTTAVTATGTRQVETSTSYKFRDS